MLDPSIILAASQNQPKFQGPLDTFQKAMALRELVNQSQLSDLAAKQQQQQYGDQQSLRTLLQGNPNPTANQIYSAAPSATGTAFLNSMNEYKMNQAKLTSAQADVAEKSADFLGRGAGLVQKANYDPKVAIQTLQAAQGTPFEQQANGLIQQIQQDPTQVKPIFDRLATQAESLKDQQAAAAAAAQAAARQQQANAATSNAATNASKADKENKAKDLATVGTLFGNAQNQNDWAMAFAKAQAAGVSKDVLSTIPTRFDPATAQSIGRQAMQPGQAEQLQQGAQRNAIEQQQANIAAGRLGVERQKFANDQKLQQTAVQALTPPNPNLAPGQRDDAFLKTLPPAMAATVKAISDGRMELSAGALRSPVGQNLAALTNRYDPTFDAGNAPARFALNKDFRSGKSAQNLRAIDTLAGHLNSLEQSSNAVGGSDLKPLNYLESLGKQAAGSPAIKAMNTNAIAVFSDAATVFKGQATEGEINRFEKDFNAAATPAERQAIIDKVRELVKSRAQAMLDTYKAGSGRDLDLSSYRHLGDFTGQQPQQQGAQPQQQQAVPVNLQALRSKYNY